MLDWGRLPFIGVEHCGWAAPKGKGGEGGGLRTSCSFLQNHQSKLLLPSWGGMNEDWERPDVTSIDVCSYEESKEGSMSLQHSTFY